MVRRAIAAASGLNGRCRNVVGSGPAGCGFPALPGWGSTHDQAKTWDCRLDAMAL